MEKVTLYSKDNAGSIRVWSIHHDEDHIYMTSGKYGGEEIEKSELVKFGLAGRTREQQIEMRINSRVNKKLDSGYVRSLKDAKNNIRVNTLGYQKAAKCSRWDEEYKSIPYDETYIQPKLNGHHCSIINDGGQLVAYSNGGKLITTIDHILEGIELKVGQAIEGELYVHGVILQTISSWVRKFQPDTLRLRFYCYDIVSDECYSERYKMLKQIDFGDNAEFLETTLVIGKFDIIPIIKQYVKRGFEGAVVRLLGYAYKAGARSKGMIKVKTMHFSDEFKIDDEFLVIDIIPSKDGWAKLVCETEHGQTFTTSCHGTMDYKMKVMKNKNHYIGKHVRGEFAEWTKDKKPFHFVAQCWRDKFNE